MTNVARKLAINDINQAKGCAGLMVSSRMDMIFGSEETVMPIRKLIIKNATTNRLTKNTISMLQLRERS